MAGCIDLHTSRCHFILTVNSLWAAGGLGLALSFPPKGNNLRSRNSQKAFRKKIAERDTRIKIPKRPSTVEIVPLRKIHTIPARGIRPSKIEIRRTTESKIAPRIPLSQLFTIEHNSPWRLPNNRIRGDPGRRARH